MDFIFDGGAAPAIGDGSDWWVALCNTTPVVGDGNITSKEADYSGYGRVLLSGSSGFGPAAGASGGLSTSILAVTFPVSADTTTTTVGFWALCNAQTDGLMRFWGAITTPIAVATDEVPILAAGVLTVQLS